jgi:hypothetical protein
MTALYTCHKITSSIFFNLIWTIWTFFRIFNNPSSTRFIIWINIHIIRFTCYSFMPLNFIKFINSADSQVCQNLFDYSIRWKQLINISKTVLQIFHAQVKQPEVEIKMNNSKLETVRSFKYLGFTWTDKMSLKPTVDKCLDNVNRSYSKLKWLQRNKNISTQVLRTCFFAYSFPFFT